MTDNSISLNQAAHHVILENRTKTTVSGVIELECFDEHTVKLYTEQGQVTFKGTGFHLTALSLDVGEVSFEGTVCALEYADIRRRRNETFFSRMFR